MATRALLTPDEDFPPNSDASAADYDAVSPTESDEAAEVEFAALDRPDSENDDKGDDDIHDVALAEEGSPYSPQGHEVTFPPSDDDQGESIRIVTEAVEPGRQDKPTVPPHNSGPKPGTAPRSAETSSSDVPPDHPAELASGEAGETIP